MLTSPVERNQSGEVKGSRARVKNDRDEVKVKEEGRLEEIRERCCGSTGSPWRSSCSLIMECGDGAGRSICMLAWRVVLAGKATRQQCTRFWGFNCSCDSSRSAHTHTHTQPKLIHAVRRDGRYRHVMMWNVLR